MAENLATEATRTWSEAQRATQQLRKDRGFGGPTSSSSGQPIGATTAAATACPVTARTADTLLFMAASSTARASSGTTGWKRTTSITTTFTRARASQKRRARRDTGLQAMLLENGSPKARANHPPMKAIELSTRTTKSSLRVPLNWLILMSLLQRQLPPGSPWSHFFSAGTGPVHDCGD